MDGMEIIHACQAHVGEKGDVVGTEKHHDSCVVYLIGKAPHLSSVSKQGIPTT
jgi:hypothetical protein